MSDYISISRDTAYEKLFQLPCKIDEDGYRWVLSRDVAHMIDEIPAFDVRPVVHGRWAFYAGGLVKCLACGYEYTDRLECDNFCGNCGADMKPAGVPV